MNIQLLKPQHKDAAEYKLFQDSFGTAEPMQALDVFEIEGTVKNVTKTTAIHKDKTFPEFCINEPIELIWKSGAGFMEVTMLKAVPTISVAPEILLGSITLSIGVIGIVSSLIANETTAALSMIGFIIAGAATIVGSRILKKRVESS